MTELRRRVERLEHAETSSVQFGADARDLANFPGMVNLVAGANIALIQSGDTLTISGANQPVIRKDFHGVTAGDELYAYMSSPMTIGGVSILATPPGDLVVDVRRTPIGSFPATGGDSICAAAKPTLAAAQTYLDTTLTGWSTVSIEGDTLTIHVDSVTTVTDFEITLYGQAEIPPLVITGHLPDATIGDMASYSYTVTGGYGTTTVTLYSGALPAGSSISTAGAVSGTYTTAGSYSWVLQVEDSLGSKAYLSDSNAIAYATLNVTGAFTDTDQGDPLNGSPLTITGGLAPYSLSGSPYSGTRPAGVTFSISGSTVVATGNTTTDAAYTWTERVLSTDGQHYDVSCSVTVIGAVYGLWNASDKGADIALSTGDTVATSTSGTTTSSLVRSTLPLSGKMYFEVKVYNGASSGDAIAFGVADATASLASTLGKNTRSAAVFSGSGNAYVNNASGFSMATPATTQVFGVAVDTAARSMWTTIAGSGTWFSNGTGSTPTSGTSGIQTFGVDAIYAATSPFTAGLWTEIICNPADFTGSAPSGYLPFTDQKIDYGSHEYWRIYITQTNSSSYSTIAEVSMSTAAGGSNLCTGGTAFANAVYSPTYAAAKAFDGNVNTFWVSTALLPNWIGYQFATPVSIGAFKIRAASAAYGTAAESPRKFSLEFSDDGSTWTKAGTYLESTSWTLSEIREFIVQ